MRFFSALKIENLVSSSDSVNSSIINSSANEANNLSVNVNFASFIQQQLLQQIQSLQQTNNFYQFNKQQPQPFQSQFYQ
jgi:hypothetical protein